MRQPSYNRANRTQGTRLIRIANFAPGRKVGIKLTRPVSRPALRAVRPVQRNHSPKPRLVDFQFYAPRARNVHVVGSFDGGKVIPLENLGGGAWVVRLLLALGRYTYHFLADGVRCPDPLAMECAFSNAGTLDSVAVID